VSKLDLDQITNLEKEEFVANSVGFTLDEYRDLKKVFSHGLKELRAAINHDLISIGEASKIAELPKEDQLEALKKLGYNEEKDLPNLYDNEIEDLINDIKGS
jgi:hypothetical protein